MQLSREQYFGGVTILVRLRLFYRFRLLFLAVFASAIASLVFPAFRNTSDRNNGVRKLSLASVSARSNATIALDSSPDNPSAYPRYAYALEDIESMPVTISRVLTAFAKSPFFALRSPFIPRANTSSASHWSARPINRSASTRLFSSRQISASKTYGSAQSESNTRALLTSVTFQSLADRMG